MTVWNEVNGTVLMIDSLSVYCSIKFEWTRKKEVFHVKFLIFFSRTMASRRKIFWQ